MTGNRVQTHPQASPGCDIIPAQQFWHLLPSATHKSADGILPAEACRESSPETTAETPQNCTGGCRISSPQSTATGTDYLRQPLARPATPVLTPPTARSEPSSPQNRPAPARWLRSAGEGAAGGPGLSPLPLGHRGCRLRAAPRALLRAGGSRSSGGISSAERGAGAPQARPGGARPGGRAAGPALLSHRSGSAPRDPPARSGAGPGPGPGAGSGAGRRGAPGCGRMPGGCQGAPPTCCGRTGAGAGAGAAAPAAPAHLPWHSCGLAGNCR